MCIAMLRRFGPHSSRWIFVIFTLIINLIAIGDTRKLQISRKQPNPSSHSRTAPPETERVVTWVTVGQNPKDVHCRVRRFRRGTPKASGYASGLRRWRTQETGACTSTESSSGVLTHGVTYRYRCGSAEGWSPEFTFKMPRVGDALDIGRLRRPWAPSTPSRFQHFGAKPRPVNSMPCSTWVTSLMTWIRKTGTSEMHLCVKSNPSLPTYPI
uniref:Putative purple acid phosphatase n=1 Tax=Ixodes ricinus TaxID=34613 RepID=A0A090X8E8_IXORI